MASMASQITSLTIVYSTVYSDADQRKPRHWLCAGKSPASNAEKKLPFDDVIMKAVKSGMCFVQV